LGVSCFWGVDARRDPIDEIDKISEFFPISGLNRFESEVKQAVVDLLMPRHPGVFVKAIPEDTAGNDCGFLAVYVARSERRPHRSEASGEKGYYQRAGTTTRMMEHFEIQDAFLRQSVAFLTLTHWISSGLHLSEHGTFAQEIHLSLSLKNTSNISATYPYVFYEFSNDFNLDPNGYAPGIIARHDSGLVCADGDLGIAIHPGTSRRMMNLKRRIVGRDKGTIVEIQRGELQDIILVFRYGCLNATMQRKEIVITKGDLMERVSIPVELI
jgi:hypothetical protein